VALRAYSRQKQHPEFKIPSSSNPSGGYKGADKATFLSMIWIVRPTPTRPMQPEPSMMSRFIAFALNAGLAWFLLTRQSSLARGFGWFVAFCALWPLINWIQAIIRTVFQSSVRTTDRCSRISYRKPLGWQLVQPDVSSPYALIHVTLADEFAPNINYHLDTSTRDAEGRLHDEVESTRQIEPSVGLCLPALQTVGPHSGFQTSTTAFMQGRMLRFYWFTLALPGGVLVITFTVPDGHQHTYLSSFHDFVASIRPA
jgi:hypothetical protein